MESHYTYLSLTLPVYVVCVGGRGIIYELNESPTMSCYQSSSEHFVQAARCNVPDIAAVLSVIWTQVAIIIVMLVVMV